MSLSSKHLTSSTESDNWQSGGVFCNLGNFPSNRSLVDCSSMANMFALLSESSPESLSFNWAVTIESRGLGSSDVTLHWSAVASIDSHGVSSGTGPLGGEFSSYPPEVFGCGGTEGSVSEMTGSGSHPAEVLSGGRGGSRAEMTDSGSHPAEVLICGGEGSGEEPFFTSFSGFILGLVLVSIVF